MDPVSHILDALRAGELGAPDLTARKLGRMLGKTTSVLYHRWGSLDGFLFAVSQRGFVLLGERLSAVASCADLRDVAVAYVTFGLECPALYQLMFERHFDWDALRRQGHFDTQQPGLVMWERLVQVVNAYGVAEPMLTVRMLHAGLHGLVSLALSGRANVGELNVTDREIAINAARELASRLMAHPVTPNPPSSFQHKTQ